MVEIVYSSPVKVQTLKTHPRGSRQERPHTPPGPWGGGGREGAGRGIPAAAFLARELEAGWSPLGLLVYQSSSAPKGCGPRTKKRMLLYVAEEIRD